jgi:hypothetical protein
VSLVLRGAGRLGLNTTRGCRAVVVESLFGFLMDYSQRQCSRRTDLNTFAEQCHYCHISLVSLIRSAGTGCRQSAEEAMPHLVLYELCLLHCTHFASGVFGTVSNGSNQRICQIPIMVSSGVCRLSKHEMKHAMLRNRTRPVQIRIYETSHRRNTTRTSAAENTQDTTSLFFKRLGEGGETRQWTR